MKKLLPPISLGLDTEDNQGEPTLYALTHGHFRKCWPASPLSQDDLARHLGELAKIHEAVNVWALNLPYDLVNLFGELLPDVFTLYLTRRRIVGARLKSEPKVKFFALERFLPKMNLAKIGQMVNLKKLDIEFNETRCIRDAQIAERAGDRIAREMKRISIPLRFSPVAGALSAFHTTIGGTLPEADLRIKEIGEKCLYGARNETYYLGYWPQTKGLLFYFDYRAQYAKAMCEELPDYTAYSIDKRPTTDTYVAECLVEVQPWNGIGVLPHHHHDRGLIFPVGTFRGTWTSEDLANPNVRVLRYYTVYNFKAKGPYLKTFTKKLIPTEKDHPINRALKKGIYTGMSGKFSQRSEVTFFTDWEKARPEDFWNGISLGDWVLANRKGKSPHHANFVWSSFIQAKGRRMQLELYEAIWKAGGKVLYGNTDSAMACLDTPLHAKRLLADFRNKLSMKEATLARVFSPGVYMFRDKEGINHISAKGVPGRLHEQIAEGKLELEADQPGTFWELLRASSVDRLSHLKNTWVRKAFSVNQNFKNRVLSRKGPWTQPVRLNYAK